MKRVAIAVLALAAVLALGASAKVWDKEQAARAQKDGWRADVAPGDIIAWNNIYPAGNETAKWYAREVGFTGAYNYGAPGLAKWNHPYLFTGVRFQAGNEGDFIGIKTGGPGWRFQHRGGSWVHNPYHPRVNASIAAVVDRLFDHEKMTPAFKDDIRYIVFDSEQIVAPPDVKIDAENQKEAIAIIEKAARKAGALREGEPFPRTFYGIAPVHAGLFNADGSTKADSAAYRVLDWWFAKGGGPGAIWKPAMKRIRRYCPNAYATTDPIGGSDARPTLPPFGAKAAGLDFVENWFNVVGASDRVPVYSAMMLKIAKSSGLPVVQGPQLFRENDQPLSYSKDLILTSNLLTLAFNARNGADPEVPWGIMHWGFRPLTAGVTEPLLRPNHGGNAPRLMENMERNRAEVIPAIRETRMFMERQRDVLTACEDIPAKVGIVLSRGGFYFAYKANWFTYFNRLSEFPFAALMANVPFEMVPDDADFSRFDLLLIPHSSFVTDALRDKLIAFEGKVSGTSVPQEVREKIPGWVDAPPFSEVGNWPWGPQRGYPLGGHFREMTGEAVMAWLRDRAVKYAAWFENILGPPDLVADPDVILNRVRLKDRDVLYAVNHRMVKRDRKWVADRCASWETRVGVRGRYRGGAYDEETNLTRFQVSFDGPGARRIDLVPPPR